MKVSIILLAMIAMATAFPVPFGSDSIGTRMQWLGSGPTRRRIREWTTMLPGMATLGQPACQFRTREIKKGNNFEYFERFACPGIGWLKPADFAFLFKGTAGNDWDVKYFSNENLALDATPEDLADNKRPFPVIGGGVGGGNGGNGGNGQKRTLVFKYHGVDIAITSKADVRSHIGELVGNQQGYEHDTAGFNAENGNFCPKSQPTAAAALAQTSARKGPSKKVASVTPDNTPQRKTPAQLAQERFVAARTAFNDANKAMKDSFPVEQEAETKAKAKRTSCKNARKNFRKATTAAKKTEWRTKSKNRCAGARNWAIKFNKARRNRLDLTRIAKRKRNRARRAKLRWTRVLYITLLRSKPFYAHAFRFNRGPGNIRGKCLRRNNRFFVKNNENKWIRATRQTCAKAGSNSEDIPVSANAAWTGVPAN